MSDRARHFRPIYYIADIYPSQFVAFVMSNITKKAIIKAIEATFNRKLEKNKPLHSKIEQEQR